MKVCCVDRHGISSLNDHTNKGGLTLFSKLFHDEFGKNQKRMLIVFSCQHSFSSKILFVFPTADGVNYSFAEERKTRSHTFNDDGVHEMRHLRAKEVNLFD